MPTEKIEYTDPLRVGTDKINDAIKQANKSEVDAAKAVSTSTDAKGIAQAAEGKSDSTQTQLDTIVIDGDSSVEAAQARVDEEGAAHPTLKARVDDGFTKTNQQLAETAHGFINVKSLGLKGDGVTNDTTAYNEAMNSNVPMLFDKGDYMVDPMLMANFVDGVKMHFNKGARIVAINSNHHTYQIMRIHDVEDVTITGFPEVVGDRNENESLTGEWGMGFSIRGTKDVYIENPIARDCWGDGFYLGRTPNKAYNENLVIVNPYGENNRRQGMSLISGKGVRILNPKMDNTNGTAPECGIDIEPNVIDDILQDIVIDNPTMSGNKRAGLLIYLKNLGGSKNPVDIKITNLRTEFGINGILVNEGRKVEGTVTIINPTILNTEQNGIYARNYSKDGARVVFEDPVLIDTNQIPAGDRYYDSAIVLGNRQGDEPIGPKGNIHFYRTSVIDTRSPKRVDRAFYAHIEQENYSMIDPVRLDALNSSIYNLGSNFNIRDINELLTMESVANGMISPSDVALVYVMKQAVVRSITVSSSYAIGATLTFINESGRTLQIFTQNEERIYLSLSTSNRGVQSITFGSTLTIKKIDDTQWIATNQVGAWTNITA